MVAGSGRRKRETTGAEKDHPDSGELEGKTYEATERACDVRGEEGEGRVRVERASISVR